MTHKRFSALRRASDAGFWRVLWLIVALAAPTAIPAAAQAQAEDTERAKALFVEGRKAYQSGDFLKALKAFEGANSIKPHPVMLFNIAQVYEAMDRLPEAMNQYQAFADAAPDSKKAPEAKKKVDELLATINKNWGVARVTSSPEGAEVRMGTLEEPSRGTTPADVRLPRGRHNLIITLAGHDQMVRAVEIAPGLVTPLEVALVPTLPVVSIQSEPSGARVFIDGDEVGVTPMNKTLAAGTHTIVLKRQDFADTTRVIELTTAHTQQAPLALSVALDKAPPMGTLKISVDEEGAEIRVDGELVGRSPLAQPIRLTGGDHKVEARMEDGRRDQQTVAIVVNERARISLDVGPAANDGISGRTWSYITLGIGGALLAGGAVTGVTALGKDGELSDCRDDDACVRTSREVDLANDVRSRAQLTDVLVVSGALVAGAGLVMYLLSDEPAPPEGRTGVALVPTPGGAAAVGTFRF